MQHIKSTTRNKIVELVGDFVLESFASFEAHGERRMRYTVRKPRGKKFIHVIEYETGAMVAVNI